MLFCRIQLLYLMDAGKRSGLLERVSCFADNKRQRFLVDDKCCVLWITCLNIVDLFCLVEDKCVIINKGC